MTFLLLIYEFFKTGLFSVGGGLATIPFLSAMGERYGWFDHSLLANMIAVGESTPGPIGVNMATYVGFCVGGEYGTAGAVFGAVIATVSLVAPSVIVIVLIAKVLDSFRENKYVKSAFYGVRPAVTGMIASAGLLMIKNALFTGAELSSFSIKAAVLFAVMLVLTNKIKLHPIFYIIAAGVVGALFSF